MARRVTDQQVRLLRQKRMQGKKQATAAAEAGMSERAARKWADGPMPSDLHPPRTWRTRQDPFEDVWATEVVPLLESDETGRLQAKTIFEHLQDHHPGRFKAGQLRTLQRRVRDWRAVHGPGREVFFEQVHPPGREGAADFTRAHQLGVKISGELLVHLLFVFRLSYSGWTHVSLAFGETYEALLRGLQSALVDLGGVPAVLRTDDLSAATHELRLTGGRQLNDRFKQVLDHFEMESTRIRPGNAHENGIAEKGNDLVKTALDQALLVRGTRDFQSVDAYVSFVRSVVERRVNQTCRERFAEEVAHLRPLPSSLFPEYTTAHATVRKWSTVRVGKRAYSVPSNLIGHQVEVRQHADAVEVWYRNQCIETMPRLRDDSKARIDYRHVIWSLVRKPGAFARYRYREELFPTPTFRAAYDAISRHRGERTDIEYVRILHLAASTMESRVEAALRTLVEKGEPFDYAAVKEFAQPRTSAVPPLARREPDLTAYDALIGGAR